MPPSRTIATGNSLLPAERQQRILHTILADSAIRVSALSRLLGVSAMTIRRDLDALEQKGLVERTHGGALCRREPRLSEFRYQSSAQKNPHLKRRIARRAAAMIAPHDTVFLGEGITPAMLLRHTDPALIFRMFSNNTGALGEAAGKAVEFILLGGRYCAASQALSGPVTLELIAQVHAAKTFLSADGLSIKAGATTQNHEIAAIDRQMIRHTRGEVILMADHTKIDRVGEYVVSPVSKIDVLVTDHKTSSEFKKSLESLGVRVVVA